MATSTIKEEIFNSQFVKALVNNAGNATAAYKEVRPEISGESAKTLGSRALRNFSNVHSLNISKVLEDIGATPKVVLGAALDGALKSKKVSDKIACAKLMAKLGNWEQKKDIFAGLTESIDTDVIDIVRVRLKKAKRIKPDVDDASIDNEQVIDIKADRVSEP